MSEGRRKRGGIGRAGKEGRYGLGDEEERGKKEDKG